MYTKFPELNIQTQSQTQKFNCSMIYFHQDALGKPSCKKSAVFLNIVKRGGGLPMFKNFDGKCVTFKGPFGSIN